MSLINKILNHSFWLLLGNSIGRFAMFLTNIIAARILSQETFGQFMMIRSTISMIEGVISGSLGSPMIKRIAEVSHQDQQDLKTLISTLFIINILIALFFAIILFFTAPFIVATFFIGSNNLVQGLYIGTLLLIVTTLATLSQSILIGIERYKELAFAAISSSFISFPIIVFFIYKFALYGAIFGVVTYFFIDFIMKYIQFQHIYKNKIFQFNFQKIWIESKSILLFSIPLFLAVLVNSVTFWYARVLAVNDTHGFESIAIFDAAFQWLSIIMLITGATTSAALPMLSKNFSRNSINSKNIFRINLFVNLAISIVMSLIFIVLSKEIMSIYGKNYIVGYKDLIILSITSVFFTLAAIYNRYMVASKNPWIIFLVTIASSIVLYLTYFIKYFTDSQNLSISILAYYLTSSVIYICVKLYFHYKEDLNE